MSDRETENILRERGWDEIGRLRAEIERLRGYTSNPRYWEGRWRDEAALTAEAAAFLDRMAERVADWEDTPERQPVMRYKIAAADCRREAKKLRGET